VRVGTADRQAEVTSWPRRAAIAHVVYSPEVRHPVEVGAGEEAHLVAWLSKRLGVQLRPPDLRDLRYQLMGGRLLPGSRGPVAQFMYADPNGTRLTLYLTADAGGGGETAFRFAQEGQVSVFYWVDRRMGYALSGGERRRAEIARALVLSPDFLLLDEPFAGIDPISVADLQQVILGLKERGIGVIITDHNVRDTLKVCDRAYIISEGEILLSGTPGEIAASDRVREIYLGESFSL